MSIIQDIAIDYANRGWMPIPLPRGSKAPILTGWHNLRLATEDEVRAYFNGVPLNIGVLLGEPSDWLIDVDLDHSLAVELAPKFLPPTEARFGRLGKPESHWLYRVSEPIKTAKRQAGGLGSIAEIRSTGCQTVFPGSVHPSGELIEWTSGDAPNDVPLVDPDELKAAVDELFHEVRRRLHPETSGSAGASGGKTRHTEADLLRRGQGYADKCEPVSQGARNDKAFRIAGNLYSLVGESGERLSADDVFELVQSWNLRNPEPLSELELSKAIESGSKNGQPPADKLPDGRFEVHPEVDLSKFRKPPHDDEPRMEADHPDPGPIPDELLRIPGFISEVMDYCMSISPYPNVAMSFCGALGLLSSLAGRKVRDTADNRTNFYVLSLAFSSAGKDHPRRVNSHILLRVGLAKSLGDKFASGEGIQDALFKTPSMLFQNDEFDGLLRSINGARDARHEAIMSTLLTMYSSASGTYPMRHKAGPEPPGVIDQPHLVVLGSATPSTFFESLSQRMLTNGLFGRMLVVESRPRGAGQEPKIIDAPPRILEVAKWWSDFVPGDGNLVGEFPQPRTIEADSVARELLIEARLMSESEYSAAESRGDPVGTTVWGRVAEQIRKLALLYAVSVNHEKPLINAAAVRWATDFMVSQTRRMLFMANDHTSKNDFDARCKELVRVLREWKHKRGDEPMPEWEVSRRLPWKPKDHDDVRTALINQYRISYEIVPTQTKPRKMYRLL